MLLLSLTRVFPFFVGHILSHLLIDSKISLPHLCLRTLLSKITGKLVSYIYILIHDLPIGLWMSFRLTGN